MACNVVYAREVAGLDSKQRRQFDDMLAQQGDSRGRVWRALERAEAGLEHAMRGTTNLDDDEAGAG